MKYLIIFSFLALFLTGCESTETKTLPTRETNDSELPWDARHGKADCPKLAA